MKMGNDLTRGPVAKTLLRFATPYLIANLLNTLYGIVDMFIVGRFASHLLQNHYILKYLLYILQLLLLLFLIS